MNTSNLELEDRVKRVLQSLENTIRGKEQLLATFQSSDKYAAAVCAQFVQLNLEELKRIKADLEGK